MISVSAGLATELARKSGCRPYMSGHWQYRAAAGGGVVDYSHAFSTEGYDTTGDYQHDHLRVASFSYRARLPYVGDGLYFPTLAVQLGMSADDSAALWYNQAAATARAVVGGDLCVNVGAWVSGAPDYHMTGYTFTKDAHLVGNPPLLELMGIGGAERLAVARLDADYTAGSAADSCTPAYTAKQLLLANGFTTADFSANTFDLADTCLDAEGVTIRYEWWKDDQNRLADVLVNLAWHGAGSLYVDRNNLLCWDHFRRYLSPTPDVTWTEDDIVAIDIYPLLDRMHYTDTIMVNNDSTFSNQNTFYISHSDDICYYPERHKSWALNYFLPEDFTAGSMDITTFAETLHSFYRGVQDFAVVAPLERPKPIHQCKLRVPFGVGFPMELGDIVGIECDQVGLVSPGYPWRIEQIAGPGANMEYEFLLHDAI